MRVVVTRPREQAAPLADRLEALGHEVVLCPLIEVEPLGDAPIDVAAYDWVIVTSANGARELARRRRGEPKRVAAIGPGTAATLRERGLAPDLVPAVATQEGLAAELPRPAGRVLLAAAEDARSFLADELDADFVPQVGRGGVPTPSSAPGSVKTTFCKSKSAFTISKLIGTRERFKTVL